MVKLVFEGIGWEFKLQQKRNSHFIFLPKPIIIGNLLKKGDKLKCYIVKTDNIKGILIPLEQKKIERVVIESNNYIL